jgi:hypothetical protein
VDKGSGLVYQLVAQGHIKDVIYKMMLKSYKLDTVLKKSGRLKFNGKIHTFKLSKT